MSSLSQTAWPIWRLPSEHRNDNQSGSSFSMPRYSFKATYILSPWLFLTNYNRSLIGERCWWIVIVDNFQHIAIKKININSPVDACLPRLTDLFFRANCTECRLVWFCRRKDRIERGTKLLRLYIDIRFTNVISAIKVMT